jgi:hypothetical protein
VFLSYTSKTNGLNNFEYTRELGMDTSLSKQQKNRQRERKKLKEIQVWAVLHIVVLHIVPVIQSGRSLLYSTQSLSTVAVSRRRSVIKDTPGGLS